MPSLKKIIFLEKSADSVVISIATRNMEESVQTERYQRKPLLTLTNRFEWNNLTLLQFKITQRLNNTNTSIEMSENGGYSSNVTSHFHVNWDWPWQ